MATCLPLGEWHMRAEAEQLLCLDSLAHGGVPVLHVVARPSVLYTCSLASRACASKEYCRRIIHFTDAVVFGFGPRVGFGPKDFREPDYLIFIRIIFLF